MNIYTTISISFCILIYLYLAHKIRKGNAEQNLATWVSWVLLDTVAGASLFVQDGNWYLLAMYVAGGTMISSFIFRSAKFKWGIVEKTSLLLVVVSIIIWTRSGPWYATIVSTIGVAIATCPQLKDAILEPATQPIEVYIGFTIINGLAVAGGKAWTIDERFYPAVCTILCALIVGFSSRKYFFVEKPHGA